MKKEKPCPTGKFPTFPVILLVVGVLWLLTELNVIAINIPWWPVILIIIALGWIVNKYTEK
ncbi:hypothetical protein KY342_06380 [Candidatus Woesearchaeota archaeon]|nr:hypothetical protein [Candidatus Woesearchaeota archaeon]